ncbi:MAG: class I SAM-dependent methyltransferase [Candidatus Pacebacteria bacterium]|nr:class I SAM-dependent methyltransferase [Candidatus Paceibacterota bacterium]
MTYIFQPARHELREQIKRHSSYVRGRVLDVGSGPKPPYRDLFDSTEYVKLDREGIENITVVGSADTLPVDDASFDALVCTQVLGDVYRLRDAFAEFFRVLRPGGAALITEAFFDSLHDEPYDYWRFTEFSLRKLAEDAGFRVEVLEKRGGYFTVRAQMTVRYLIGKHDIYNRWYSRVFSRLSRSYFGLMSWRDRRDKSEINARFAHGYLLIARKPE